MNVYRIGVSIAMSNGVSPVLGVIARDILGLHGKVGQLSKGFSRLKLAIGGALAVAGGAAILGTMGRLLDASEDLTHAQGKLLAAGLSNKQVAEATGRAWQMSHDIMGARVAENLTAIGHLRAAIGDLKEAERVAPAYQRNAVAIGAIMGRPGEAEAFKLAQAIHLSGAANNPVTKKLDPDKFTDQMHLYTAMIAAGNGKLSPQDLLQFQKQAGSYGGNLTNQGRIDLTGFVQAVGGRRAGTIVSTMNRALKDGVMQLATLTQLESIGLIDPKKVVRMKGRGFGGGGSPGGSVQFKPGALADEKLFREDLPRWVWTTLVAKLRAHGLKTTDDQINWVQHAKLTTNVTRGLAEMIRNQGVDQTEAANVVRAAKADQYKAVMGKDFKAQKKAFGDAWHDFLTALAVPLIPAATNVLKTLTGAIKGMTLWSSLHPGTIKLIGGAIVVLGAALVGFGAVAVGVAAFAAVAAGGVVGAVVAGIGALVGAVTALVVLNWGAIKSAAQDLWDFIKKVVDIAGKVAMAPVHLFENIAHGRPVGQIDMSGLQMSVKPTPVKPLPQLDLSGKRASPLPPAANHNRPSAAPPPMRARKMSFNGDVYLDDQKVGRVIYRHQADALDRTAFAVGADVDPRMTLSPVGLSAA